MSAGKYSKYVMKAPTLTGDFPPLAQRVVFDGETKNIDATIGFRYSYFTGPPFQFEVPHTHEFDQYLIFIGPPEDVREFDSEIELWLGKEMEKHTITESTIVFVPKGLMHTPMNFKRIDKPVLLINITLSPEYKKEVAKK